MDRKRRKKHKIPHSSDASHDKDRRRAYSEGNYVKSLVVAFEKLNDAEMDSDSSVFSDSDDSEVVRRNLPVKFNRSDSYRSAINDGWRGRRYVAEAICKYESRPSSLAKSASFGEKDGRDGREMPKFFSLGKQSKIPVAKQATLQLYLEGNDGDSFYENFLHKKLSPVDAYPKDFREKRCSGSSEGEALGDLKEVEDEVGAVDY